MDLLHIIYALLGWVGVLGLGWMAFSLLSDSSSDSNDNDTPE